eukprot:m.69493 g.69493  ORF g.69493 m.69493 type:complete len:82 (-) comp13992_c0_seq1:43-288(-)
MCSFLLMLRSKLHAFRRPPTQHGLYNDDVLEEESILSWYKTHDSQDELKKKLHTQVKPLIEWLENAEEESDEGESSEEDSD